MNVLGRILVVDDDIKLSRLISRFLVEHGFNASIASDGKEMNGLLERSSFDLVVLDLNLPGLDGLTLCKTLRRHGCLTPVIMLTARGSDSDRIHGLELGADDYMTKPFNPLELLARIKAVLRRQTNKRNNPHEANDIIFVFNEFELNTKYQTLKKAGENIKISTAEFSLLRLLLTEAGNPLNRTQIFQMMSSREHQPDQRAIDMLISRLRKKLDHPEQQHSIIKTIHGIGYVIVDTVMIAKYK